MILSFGKVHYLIDLVAEEQFT